MQLILSHNHLDFDGLASMIAAKKLHPQSMMVLPHKRSSAVDHFLAIYKDAFAFHNEKKVDWKAIDKVILVDTANLARTGFKKINNLKDGVSFHVYDHHQQKEDDLTTGIIQREQVGATVTLLVEQLQQQNIKISSFEATIFALGLYSDTGAFCFDSTTARDLHVGAFLVEQGAQLQIIKKYRQQPLEEEQHLLLQSLLNTYETYSFNGVEILLAKHRQEEYTNNLAIICRRMLETTKADAVFALVEMGNTTFLTARSSSDRINVLPVIEAVGGGGHEQAAAGKAKNAEWSTLCEDIRRRLEKAVKPAITAENMMSSPVRVIAPDTAVIDASKMLYRYGHTGFPVIQDGECTGIISRRDVDKALHHGLGHAPVKGYMSRNPQTISKEKSLEGIQEIMIEHNIGRLPVIDDGQMIGIVSRTDVIRAIHGKKETNDPSQVFHHVPTRHSVYEFMSSLLSKELFTLLKHIGEEAKQLKMNAFIIGGIVRDILLHKNNEDIDIVVEGNGIELANTLANSYGGFVRTHPTFQTATWKHTSGFKIDITSARTEYYDYPAALPDVEMSSIKEDLYRRDFTINAMAINLHPESFGTLIDYFHGYEDLKKGHIRTLYNLSFVEDPTRLLRAIRFETRFNFSMDEETERFAYESVQHIHQTSTPRIASELKRLTEEGNPKKGFERLQAFGICSFLFQKLRSNEDILLDIEQFSTFIASAGTKSKHWQFTDSIWLSYMTFTIPCRPGVHRELQPFSQNKQDDRFIEQWGTLIDHKFHEKDLTAPLSEWHQWFHQYDDEPLLAWAYHSDMTQQALRKTKMETYINSRSHLPQFIDGNNLQSLGFKPGPCFRDILFTVEQWLLDDPTLSRTDIETRILQTFHEKKED
ncbi:CBS domain-containing protein [Texcoconibacillus texcoconensis]|uniref:tRNA nucleotidyltransferase (CCA-adding enzyme) n=1 Tax=Texcoconibacillus texcoconensis TaxID=1095777 RepID=A0A840QRL5_9BACI|nr:CBS domain-containing protein [Texcoconibacillus texcoconensis]MBB5173989.1 tRNA nucleotidyltransferase (CCA-adding enzyme) [Texcoconibacillus texcoconensis]